MADNQQPISYKDFAKKIKAKYPDYKDIDDLTLSQKMVEKYPEYKGQVFFEEVKKKEPTASSATQLQSPKIESMAAPALQFGASLEKSIKPSIREAALADKKNNQSYLGALWNNAVGSASRLARGVTRLASKFEATPAMDIERRVLDIAGQSMNKNLIAAKEKEYADKVGGFIEKARTSTSSKEYEKKLAEGFDITDGIGVSDLKALGTMIPQLVADIGLAVPTAGTSFAIQGYDDALSLIDEMPEAKNISEGTRTAFGFGGALVIGALEKLGLDNILKNPSAKRYVTAKVLKEATDELVKKGVKVTAEQFEKQVADKAKEIAKKEGAKVLAKSFLKKGAIEGGTEAGQEAAMDLLKIATNKLEGKEIFDEEEMKDTAAARYLNSFAAGGVLGGLAGAVSTRFQNTEKAIKSKLAEAKTQEDIASIVDEINQNVQEGTITEDEANDLNSMVESFSEVSAKIPQEVIGENREKSIDLLLERNKLESEIQDIEKQKEGVDAAYHGFFDEGVTESNKRIEEINKELAELAKPENQIIETEETTEIPIQAEAEVADIETPTEIIGATEVTEAEPIQEEGVSQKGIERAEAKKIYKKVNETDIPNDAEGIALSYLAGGGKVSEAAINEVVGRVKRARLNTGERELKSEEAKARDYYQKEGKSLDDIAHDLWESSNQEVSEQDIKNALMDAIANNNTRLDAAKQYLERYNPEYAEEQYYNQLYEQKKAEVEAEEAEINKWLAEEGEREFELAADEEYINQLIKKYETDLETEIEQPATESQRTSSEKVSSEKGGAEVKPTITESVKKEKDAISKQKPDEVDVRQQAKDGERVGEGNIQPEKPTQQKETKGDEEKVEPPKIKEGVSELFETNPELKSIGTEQEYSEYLDNVFPESKIKNILYHKTSSKQIEGDRFKISRLGGVYFSFFDIPSGNIVNSLIKKITKENTVFAVVNVKNPFIVNKKNAKEVLKKTGLLTQDVTKLQKKFDLTNNDAVLGFPNERFDTGQLDDFPNIKFNKNQRKDVIELAVINPDNIHILGSKKDIEGFKNFVGSTQKKSEPPKPPKPPKETEGSGEKPLKTDNKSILTRIYESENITPSVKEKFKDKLKYKVSSQDEARSIAKEMIKEFGIDDAVTLAEAGKFDGDVNSFIFAEALDATYQSEIDAKTSQEKAAFAEKWADIAMRYDESARDKGRFIAAIADFYRKSPLGIKIAEETRRSEEFKKWFKNKEEGYKEVYEEIVADPEFKEYVQEEVQKELKKERAEFRKERRKKIEDTFDGFKINKDALYAIPIPPNVYNGAVEAMKQAFLAGESIANAVEVAVEKISAEIKDWDKDKFRKEYQEKLNKIDSGKKGKKTPEELTQEKKEKLLDRFRNKLKGLSEKEKEEVIRKSFKKLVENGALEYDDFKQIIAETIGLGEMSAEETAIIQQLVKDINDVEELAQQIRQEDARSLENLKKYREAKERAEKSATKLGQIVYNKPNIVNRLLSVMQLNTLGIPSLVNNPIFNIANQAVVRFPIGVQLSVLDQVLYRASKVTDKLFGTGVLLPENNIATSQKEFIKKLWQGSKQSTEQLFTGLTNKDYFQKEVYSSQIHPFTSAKELWDYSFKGKKLTPSQVGDKAIQATVGMPAEVVARLLNIGDKPQRYAAEGAQAAVFAKNLGLKDIVDYEYFLEFPKEEAFRQFKKQGLSDEAAMKKAEEIKSRIIKQGEESVFQEDNLLNDAVNAAFKPFGTAGEIVKKFNLPFLKIPLNAFWSYFNIVNPEVALLQSAVYAAKAIKTKSPIDIQQSKKWAAHATTGMALMAIAGALAKEGIVNSDNDDETTKKERSGEQQYEQQKSINLTKLNALLSGKDPNEVTEGLNVDLKWLGVIGNVLNIQANKIEEMTPEQKEKGMSYMEDLLSTMTLSGVELIDNGVFSNASGLLTAITKGGSFADQYFLNLINMGTNIIQPAMFAQVSRAQLPYYSQQKADDFYGKLENSLLARSSILRKLTDKYPPSKIGIWGDPMERTDNVLMKLFSISKSRKDNFAQPIYDDYKRTGNTKFFPSSVKPEIDKQKLNTEQARQFEILVGQERKRLIAPYIHDGAILKGYKKVYSKLTDEEKIAALEDIYEQGYQNAKQEFIKLYPEFEIKKERDRQKEKMQAKKQRFKSSIENR